MDEIILHFGNHSRPWTKPFSILETALAHGRNCFPFWKSLSPMDETISHFGNHSRPWTKPFSILEDGFVQGWGFIFHFGKRFPKVGILFSILENGSPELGFHFPFWKMESQDLKSQKQVRRRVIWQGKAFKLR